MNQKGFSLLIFIYIIAVLSLLIIGGSLLVKNYFIKAQSKNVNPTPQTQEKKLQDGESLANSSALNNGSEIKYIGTINEFNNGCWSDGNCSVKIDDKWIITVQGGLRPSGVLQEPVGKLIGLDLYKDTQNYVGREAEVYAKILKDDLLTIYGTQNYYVKVLNN